MAGWLDELFNGEQFKGQDPKGLLEMLSQLAQPQADPRGMSLSDLMAAPGAGPSQGFAIPGPPPPDTHLPMPPNRAPIDALPVPPPPGAGPRSFDDASFDPATYQGVGARDQLPPAMAQMAGATPGPAPAGWRSLYFPPDARAEAPGADPSRPPAPPTQPEGPGMLERVGRHVLQALHDNSTSMIAGGGAMISGGLGHGLSAMAAATPLDIAARKERQGNAAIQATYEAVLRQQLARGVPMADAQATALGASQNAELLKTVVGPQYQHVEIKGIGGDTQVGAFDPRTGKVTVNGQPAGTAAVSGPDMPSGQEYLDKYVPKNVHAFIKAAANYDVPISGMGTLKQLQPHILNYDPSYDAANYASKVALKKNYLGGGKNYEELKSFERLGNHLNTLREAVQDLNPTSIVGVNSLRNLFSDYGVNDPKVIALRNALNTVNHELGNAYHAGHITDSTLHAFQQNLNDTMSVPGFKAGIGTMGELVHGIIKSNENAFNAALPGEKGPKEFKALSEETRQKFQTINEWAHGVGRGAAAATAPPSPPTAPKKGDTVKGSIGGKPVTVEFDGTNWVPK